MSRYAHNIYQVHIADGFESDCDELIHKCLQYQTLNFQMFCEIWKDMHFGMIYQGRSSGAEIAELTEEAIHIAKQYMIKDCSNFEESVAGLFIVYGLLTLQPFRGFACLRIIPDDVPAINRIQVYHRYLNEIIAPELAIARLDRRLDVLYILGVVLVKYTQYHAAERDYGMESVLRKYLEGYTSIDKLGVRPRGVFYRQNEEMDIIRDLSTITRQYTRAKNSLISQPDVNLKYIDENLANELNTSLKKLINGILEHENDSDDDSNSKEDHSETVQSIKVKAMSNTVNPIRHLTGLDGRKPETATTKSSPKSDLKPTSGKIKKNSPTKPITNSPKKQKFRTKNIKKQSPVPNTSCADLNLDDFNKINENTEEEEKLHIELDSLPITIEMETGQDIEIEYIDNSLNTESGQPSPMKRKRTDSMDKKKRSPRKKPRYRIKSKFKKMGMLPVANFNESK